MLRILNPAMRTLLRSPLHRALSKELVLLCVQGRKTNRTYSVVVGRHQVDGMFLVSASGSWRSNLQGGAPGRVTLDGVQRAGGHAELEEDPGEVARIYRQLLETLGHDRASVVGLRVNVGRLPTPDELKPAVVRRGIARVRLDGTPHDQSSPSA